MAEVVGSKKEIQFQILEVEVNFHFKSKLSWGRREPSFLPSDNYIFYSPIVAIKMTYIFRNHIGLSLFFVCGSPLMATAVQLVGKKMPKNRSKFLGEKVGEIPQCFESVTKNRL